MYHDNEAYLSIPLVLLRLEQPNFSSSDWTTLHNTCYNVGAVIRQNVCSELILIQFCTIYGYMLKDR